MSVPAESYNDPTYSTLRTRLRVKRNTCRANEEVQDDEARGSKYRPGLHLLFVMAALLVAVVLVVVLGVCFGISHHGELSKGTSGIPTPSIIYGEDGTVVTTEHGTPFNYNNSFSGYFVQDSGNPFNNDARA